MRTGDRWQMLRATDARWSSLASEPDEGAIARREAARRKIDDCDHRLGRYRAALEAGADPIVVAGWMTEVRGKRLAAERGLARLSRRKMTGGEVKAPAAGGVGEGT